MGYSLSWIAIRGIAPDEVERLLGIRALATEEALPKSSCTAALLKNGWHIVFFTDGCDSVERRAENLIASSREAITLFRRGTCHGERCGRVEERREGLVGRA